MTNRRIPSQYYPQPYQQPVGRQPVTWVQAARIYVAGSKRTQAFAAAHAIRLGAFLARTWPFMFSLLATLGIVGDDVTGVGVADDPLLGVSVPMMFLTAAWAFLRIAKIKARGIRS